MYAPRTKYKEIIKSDSCRAKIIFLARSLQENVLISVRLKKTCKECGSNYLINPTVNQTHALSSITHMTAFTSPDRKLYPRCELKRRHQYTHHKCKLFRITLFLRFNAFGHNNYSQQYIYELKMEYCSYQLNKDPLYCNLN